MYIFLHCRWLSSAIYRAFTITYSSPSLFCVPQLSHFHFYIPRPSASPSHLIFIPPLFPLSICIFLFFLHPFCSLFCDYLSFHVLLFHAFESPPSKCIQLFPRIALHLMQCLSGFLPLLSSFLFVPQLVSFLKSLFLFR